MMAEGSNGDPPPTRYLACLPVFLGGVAALIVGCAGIIVWLLAHRIPVLDDSDFDAAFRTWQAVAPSDYEIEIEVFGRQASVYRAVVRDGKPASLHRNGSPLPQERTWRTWTVEGMFGTIRRDVIARKRSNPPTLQLRCEFDKTYRFPRRYSRIEYGQPSDVSWIVREFQRFPGEKVPPP